MSEQPLISVVIATSVHRTDELERTTTAYLRESEGIVVELLPYELGAWHRGAREASGIYLHLTGDWLEPHPGWWHAAISAVKAGFVPAPMLWRSDGTRAFDDEPEFDWEPCGYSRAPFLSREQLDRTGMPPDEGRWPELPTVFRCDYAFTLHEHPTTKGAP